MYMLCDVVNNVNVMLIMLLHIVELVEVKFDYDAEQSDKLRLHVGDIIKSCELVEDGWMEGGLSGK